jgi:hypothetical protein
VEFNEAGEDDEDGGEGSEIAEGWDDLLMDSDGDDDGSVMDIESDVY